MRILILGHTGHLGRTLLRISSQRYGFLPFTIISPKIDFVKTESIEQLKGILRVDDYDCLINCCAVSGGITLFDSLPKSEIYGQNIAIGLNVVKAFTESNCPKLINILSSCAYPFNSQQFLETDILDGRPHDSTSAIGEAKRAIYRFGLMKGKESGKTIVHACLSTLYGPSGPFLAPKAKFFNSIVYKLVKAVINEEDEVELFGFENTIRDVVFEEDAANMILNLAEYSTESLVNITSDERKKISEYVDSIILCLVGLGYNNIPKIKFNNCNSGQERKFLSNKKCKSLGYFEQSGSSRAINKTVKFCLDNFKGIEK